MEMPMDIVIGYLAIGALTMVPLSRFGRDIPFPFEFMFALFCWPVIWCWGLSK